MTNKTTLCIIPARGGSKGIPGKNIRMVGGKPLLAWSIEQARGTPRVSRVLVSTDSDKIAAVARDYGAEVVERPAEISGDTASSESSLAHALDYLKEKENLEADLAVFLQATSPLREADDIQKAIETLERENADSLFSACRSEGFIWRVDKDGLPRSFTYDHKSRPRRQDAPEDLVENGSIYIFKPWVLRRYNNRLGGKVAVYRMPALKSFQIDEPEDLELMERLMVHRGASLPPAGELRKVKLLALDFDGVLTDNRVLVSEDGKEAVLCNRSDSLGIGMLKEAGIQAVVISKEKNPVVAARCRKLGIECIQGCDEKLSVLQKLVESKGFKQDETAYVGNDVNDLECLQWAGVSVAVADSAPEVIATARFRTPRDGGCGAVRDVIDWLVNSRR
jgi:N-acylneuraminate cytidylyltransferase